MCLCVFSRSKSFDCAASESSEGMFCESSTFKVNATGHPRLKSFYGDDCLAAFKQAFVLKLVSGEEHVRADRLGSLGLPLGAVASVLTNAVLVREIVAFI